MQQQCTRNAGARQDRAPTTRNASPVRECIKRIAVALIISAAAMGLPKASASVGGTLVIRNDRGGNIDTRARQISRLRSEGTRVEIRGRYCMSACTMYLGLRNTCILPNTVFGFHGPSSPYYGIALPPEEFEYWSRVMASHYPRQLQDWFLREARNTTMGFLRISGRELIQMGIQRCA